MNMLEVPGAFTMLVPDGWSVTLTEGTYELTRDDDDGAAHISVLGRRRGRLQDGEAAELVVGFLEGVGIDGPGEIRVLTEGRRQHRAVTRATATTDGQEVEWLVFVVLWPRRLVLCTAHGSPWSSVHGEAERMFATIHRPRWFHGPW